jgi:hypothetical protein
MEAQQWRWTGNMREQAMMREDERDRVARQGMQAWARLKKGKSWTDWLQVGEALQVGREWAMHQAGVNKPEGKGYNTAFSEWLTKYKLDDMDKGDRSRLFSVMDNLPAIDEWRQTLTLTQKLALNHPQAVLRKWKAFMKPEERDEHGQPRPTLRDSVVNLSEENMTLKREVADLKAHIADLEAARETEPQASTAKAVDAREKWKAFAELMPHLTEQLNRMNRSERLNALIDLAEPFPEVNRSARTRSSATTTERSSISSSN